ncbi:MAG: sugar transferase [Verrucomicrobiota bacterium]
MIGQRTRGIQSLLTTLQGALLVVLFWLWLAGYLYLNSEGEKINFEIFLNSYLIYCVALLIGFWFDALMRSGKQLDLYDTSLIVKIPLTFRETAASVFALSLLLVLTKDRFLSRVFLTSFIPALYLMLLWSNHRLPRYLARKFFPGARSERTLLVGSAARADKLKDWLDRKERLGFRCVGVLCNDPGTRTPLGLPILGTYAQIEQVLKAEDVSQVILLDFLGEQRNLVRSIQSHGARMHILSITADILGHPIVIEQDEGYHFIALHEEPLENPVNRTLKRALDLAVSIPVVVFILPVLSAIVWLAQRLQSPGPVFYLQTRAGMQNEEFPIIKFRSMKTDHGEVAKQATDNDDRVYPVGRFLRRFSVDEVPQFLNVLRGEMSVVGPRPHLIEHNRQFAEALENYHSRAFVKPGITGLAQVRGFRGETKTMNDIQQRLESDLIYLENWSLLLDLGILLRTVWQVCFPPRTAY